MNKREEAIYVLGMLGYRYDKDEYENALKLLEENELTNLIDFNSELNIYNYENEASSRVSLAGLFPSFKIKNGDWWEVEGLMRKCNVSI